MARWHQVQYRENILKAGHDRYVTWLTRDDAERGLNFYNRLCVFETVKARFPQYRTFLYADMLRSEHIPFNFFGPLGSPLGRELCKEVLNHYLEDTIQAIHYVKIEYAPAPREQYLNDRTSFDVYLEYTHKDGKRGLIGIEVKYTEGEYHLKKGSTEETAISDPASAYHIITKKCNIYECGTIPQLKQDCFRQLWRNQLLAESIRLRYPQKYEHSTSIIVFPKGNEHFTIASRQYTSMLRSNSGKFVAITYENLLNLCGIHCPDKEYDTWLKYLKVRYIIP